MPDVNEGCDRVGILNHGKLVAAEKVRTISASGNYKALEEYLQQMEELIRLTRDD